MSLGVCVCVCFHDCVNQMSLYDILSVMLFFDFFFLYETLLQHTHTHTLSGTLGNIFVSGFLHFLRHYYASCPCKTTDSVILVTKPGVVSVL